MAFVLSVLAMQNMRAQTIRKGDRFFDGVTLYTVQEVRMDKYVYMTGSDDGELTLEKVEGKAGMYTLQPSRQAEEPLFGAQFGWRVQYIRQEGMNFLAVRNPNGDAVWVMTLTPDDKDACLEQQNAIMQELPSEITSNTLLNRYYLSQIPNKQELRLMRNEILARHGYRFKSKDLQDWFGQQHWYKPGNNNNAIKLNIIEQTNVQLIKSEEQSRTEEKISDVTRGDFRFEVKPVRTDSNGDVGLIRVKGYITNDDIPYFDRTFELQQPVGAERAKEVRWVNDTDDINFDGVPDLQVYLWANTVGRVSEYYAAYVWNVANCCFEEVKGYDSIANPVVDAEKKTITGTARTGAAEKTISTYAWRNGILKKIGEKKESLFAD